MREKKYGNLKEENKDLGNISIITEETKPEDSISDPKKYFQNNSKRINPYN